MPFRLFGEKIGTIIYYILILEKLIDNLRIGLSMRSVVQESYCEKRDVIAEDWSNFFLNELPYASWMYLPNIGDNIIEYIRRWKLNAFVLSGGEDIGTDEKRDNTERNILIYANKNEYPVLGVCRGLQLMFKYYGGYVQNGGEQFVKDHVATSHTISYGAEKILVNSYHQNKLNDATLPQFFKVEAVCLNDSSIEAISGKNMLGVMWHPERKLNYNKQFNKLISNFLYKKVNF